MTRRRLVLDIDVGENTTRRSCGTCPFRALDWNGGEPIGREFCTSPGWDMEDVTGGERHTKCIDAEAVENVEAAS